MAQGWSSSSTRALYHTDYWVSAATPVFAAIVSQLNAVRLAQGKPRMGFLNPWLYTISKSGFKDIVDGGSGGCYGTPNSDFGSAFVPGAGWNATEGWDPVTGLGTPSFQSLARLAVSAVS